MGTRCDLCGQPVARRKNRYCPRCTKVMRRRMRQDGYLQDTYVPPYFSESLGRPAGSRVLHAGARR